MKPLATLALIVLGPIYVIAFQSNQKPNILFQELKAKSHLESLYSGSLESQIRVSLVGCKRINVITRDSTYWKNLRRELELKDFTDEKSVLRLGELSGASHYLDATFIRYVTDQKSERQSDGTYITTHSATVEISLSLINLTSGKQETSFSIEKTVWAKNPTEARTKCLSDVAEEVRLKFVHYFPITTTVTGLKYDTREATISTGGNDGVLIQSAFALSTDRSVVAKVVEVSAQSATLRLSSKDIAKLQVGSVMNESFETARNSVRVVNIIDGVTYIDAGQNMGIKKGDIFAVSNLKLVTSTPSPIYDESFPAALVVTQVQQDFSKTRIAKGFNDIQKDTELVSSDDNSLIKRRFVFAGYKFGVTPKIKANHSSGVVNVTNNVGDFQVSTDYNNGYKDISSVVVYTLGFGTHNLAKRLSTSLNADIYNVGNGQLKNWIAHLDVTHEERIVEDRLYLFYGAGVGWGTMRQGIPNSVLETISAGKSSDVRVPSWFGSAKVGVRLYIWRVGLSAVCSYDLLKYDSWTYTAGDQSDVKVPDALLPYPVVKLSGLYASGILSYTFN